MMQVFPVGEYDNKLHGREVRGVYYKYKPHLPSSADGMNEECKQCAWDLVPLNHLVKQIT